MGVRQQSCRRRLWRLSIVSPENVCLVVLLQLNPLVRAHMIAFVSLFVHSTAVRSEQDVVTGGAVGLQEANVFCVCFFFAIRSAPHCSLFGFLKVLLKECNSRFVKEEKNCFPVKLAATRNIVVCRAGRNRSRVAPRRKRSVTRQFARTTRNSSFFCLSAKTRLFWPNAGFVCLSQLIEKCHVSPL